MSPRDRRLHRPLAAALAPVVLLLAAPACSRQAPPDAHADHDEHQDDAHEGATTVVLTPAQESAAGVRTIAAAPGRIARTLVLPAVVAADADAVTHVNPKAPGIVRSIHRRLGERVEAGELLATIDSVAVGSAVAELVRARALVEAADATLERERELFEERLETAERVLSGAIEVERRIHAREEELQRKAVSTLRPLLEADKALELAELERERQLTELRATRDARLFALEVERTERAIREEAARNALVALGLDPDALDAPGLDPELLAGRYEIRAPRGGIVAGRHITAGEYVDAQTKLFTLEDLARVWVVASAFEDQIRSLSTGQRGRIRLDAFPDAVLEGTVALVGYEVDRETRSLGVRLELENPTLAAWSEELPLRPGMYGSVELVVEELEAPVALPEAAVVHEEAGDFVFVRTRPGTYERRPVRLAPPTGDTVAVLEGLAPGEEVVRDGTFALKSALREGELGGGHDH